MGIAGIAAESRSVAIIRCELMSMRTGTRQFTDPLKFLSKRLSKPGCRHACGPVRVLWIALSVAWLSIAWLGATSLGVMPAPVAWADDDSRARTLWQRGNQLFNEGKYRRALAAFEKSYELSERPRILVAIANTLELLGRYEQALATLKKYEPHADGAADLATMRERMRSLEARIQSRDRGAKAAAGGAPAADNAAADDAPAADSDDITLHTQPAASGEATDASMPDRAEPDTSTSGSEPPPAIAQAAAPNQADQGPRRRLAPWLLTGTGGAVLIGGITLGLVARNVKSQIDRDCRQSGSGIICLSDADDRKERYRGLAWGANIGMAAGAVLLTTGALWLWYGTDEGAAASSQTETKSGAQTAPQLGIVPGSGRRPWEVFIEYSF